MSFKSSVATGAHLPGLDAIRALAIAAVIAAHIALAVGWHFNLLWIPGDYSLVMFFVLSGFLITHLLLVEHEQRGTVSLRHFYSRRALKIFPAFYFFWLVAVAALLLSGRSVPWGYAWSAFFYYSNYFQALHLGRATIFSHTWSLAVEEQFYLLWPLLLVRLAGQPVRLTRILCAGIVALWLYRWFLVFVVQPRFMYSYFAFETRADAIFVGCLLAVLLHRGLLDRLAEAITRHAALPLLTLVLLALVAVPEVRVGFRWRDVIGHTLFPVFEALLLLQLVRLGSTSWRWLETPWLRVPGKASYTLYLWQQLTIPVGVILARGHGRWIQVLAALTVTAAVSALSYQFVERPFLRLKARVGYPARESAVADT